MGLHLAKFICIKNIFSKVLLFVLIFVFSAAVLPPNQVSAQMSESERSSLGTPFFDPDEFSLCVGTACACGGGFIGSENSEIAFNYFRQQGLTPEQAAGIVGNLYAESGVMPNRKQGSGMQTINSVDKIVSNVGFGIAQWTTSGRQQAWISFAESNGEDALSLQLQLKFLMHELETNSSLGYEELLQAGSLIQATWIFLAYFERPAVVVDAGLAATPTPPTSGEAKKELDARTGYAAGVLENYGDGDIQATCGDLNTSEPSFARNPNIQVDGSPSGPHRPSNCTGSFTAGAASLRDFVLDIWSPPVTSVGGYSCRSIVGSSSTSIHGLGRAIDIMVDATTPEGLKTGNEIRNHLINNAERYGIQRVIWNRHTWVANRDGWNPYGGPNPHTDHLHVEINVEASLNLNLAP
jgi:hypothetical protein